MSTRGVPALPILRAAKVCFLLAFFVLAVTFGPFLDSDTPITLLTGFGGVAGMTVQNAVQRVHRATVPPTTLMTGNIAQAVLDAVDLVSGVKLEDTPAVPRPLRGIASLLSVVRLQSDSITAGFLVSRPADDSSAAISPLTEDRTSRSH